MSDYQNIIFTVEDGIAHLQLNRPAKKNAIHDPLIEDIDHALSNLTDDIKVIVLSGNGTEFCAGLDLSELKARNAFEVVKHSNNWHRIFANFQSLGVPMVAAMHGAVIGGGMEIAACAHVRVADETTYYSLPEGRHGIFTGGGASVNVRNIIGATRMTEMMLTGRKLNAEEGERIAMSHYVVPAGQHLEKAFELARTIATNSPYSNWAMATGIARIDQMSSEEGLYAESLICGITQTSPEVQARLDNFLNRKKK